jgi:hypothetical protein
MGITGGNIKHVDSFDGKDFPENDELKKTKYWGIIIKCITVKQVKKL